jgi:hypothetical protein
METVCCKLFFEAFAKKRNEDRLNDYLFIILLSSVNFMLVYFIGENMLIKQIMIIFVTGLIMFMYADIKLWKSFCIAILFQSLLLAVDYVFYLYYLFMNERFSLSVSGYEFNWDLSAALAKLTLFMTVLFLKTKIARGDAEDILKGAEWLRFIIFPIFSIVVLCAMAWTTGGNDNIKVGNMDFIIAFGLVAINIIVFYLVCDILKRERRIREDNMYRIKVRNQTELYKALYTNYEKQRKKAHEYKNQVMCMEGLLKKKQYDELEKYIDNISGKLSGERSCIRTNNALVDAIINTKYKEMEEKGILCVLVLTELKDLPIEDDDIVVILSNLLNNAIEACEKSEKKIVKMKLVKEDNDIVISVKNSYNGVIVKDCNDFVSSKEDTDGHGFGIKNIKESVSKYGGTCSITYDDIDFTFSILIPYDKEA